MNNPVLDGSAVEFYEWEQKRDDIGKMRTSVSSWKQGMFRSFGLDYEEEMGPFSVAIIELPDGRLKSIPVEQCKFVRDKK